jgi:serine protease inhibitor
MKKNFKHINILLLSTLLFLGCSNSEIEGAKSLDIYESELGSLSSRNKFDFDFFKNLDNSKKENTYFSPYTLNDI